MAYTSIGAAPISMTRHGARLSTCSTVVPKTDVPRLVGRLRGAPSTMISDALSDGLIENRGGGIAGADAAS